MTPLWRHSARMIGFWTALPFTTFEASSIPLNAIENWCLWLVAMANTIVCIGTGPSLTNQQVDIAREKGFRLFGCNNAFLVAPDLELLYAINEAWWERYWPSVESLPCEKWTGHKHVAERFRINHIEGRLMIGFAPPDADYISHGHGGGFSVLSMAYRAQPDRILLLGYDMKYAPDYDGSRKQSGSTPRHFFGEYPPEMRHFPRGAIEEGRLDGLIRFHEAVAAQANIINCTPDSALTCYPSIPIEDIPA